MEELVKCSRCGKDFKTSRRGTAAFLHEHFGHPLCDKCRAERLTKYKYMQEARKHIGDVCEACGQTTNLTVHHVDQMTNNNSTVNIQTLCLPCHYFWHQLAKRRRWPTAGRMPNIEGIHGH